MYNPDGRAYILEEEDLLSQVPRQEGCVITKCYSHTLISNCQKYTFPGQIVYNPDGSAYILEEEDLLSQVPRQEGSIVDRAGANNQVGGNINCQCNMGSTHEYPRHFTVLYTKFHLKVFLF